MAKKKNRLPRKYYLTTLALIIIGSILLVIFQTAPNSSISTQNELQPSDVIFEKVLVWKNNAVWSAPTDHTENTYLGEIHGKVSTATVRANEPTLSHFEDANYLKSLGYEVDSNLYADGPGSSMWGYKKGDNNNFELVIFSYNTTPTNSDPNQPVQFDCPCEMKIQVFVGSSNQKATQGTTLSNPASENCTAQGGILTIETMGSGGQFGLCTFEDNMSCEEWALYRGECPIGGVKTTGYDNIEQMYCAWLGGKTLAEEDASCDLPNGNTCLTSDLYNGKCS